jgi:WD40 repeat protein
MREKNIRIGVLNKLEEAPAGALLGTLTERVGGATFDPTGDRVASIDGKRKIQLWSSTFESAAAVRTVGHHDDAWVLRFATTGSILATASHADGTICIWDLTGPPEADALVLRKPGNQVNEVAFHPSGRWIAAVGAGNLRFWPLTRAYPLTLRGHTGYVAALVFDPAGRWLASDSLDGTVRVWSLSPGAKDAAWTSDVGGYSMAMDDQAEKLILGGVGFIRLLSRSTGEVIRELGTEQVFEAISIVVSSVTLGPGARLAAATGGWDQDGAIGIWELEADRFWTVDAGDSTAVGVKFTPGGKLLAGGDNGLRLWDVEASTYELLREGVIHGADVSGDGQTILSVERSGVFVLDRQTGESIELTAHRGQDSGALDPTGEWVVTGSFDTGEIRYGPVTGEEAHLLVKHAQVGTLEFDPQGRWIASGGMDGTIRLWPIPTGQPFHTLPYEEFVDRLRTLTNIRVVPDEEGGYKFHWEPFPGWAEAPTW